MLKALYEYAQRMNLTLPAGYADKTIKAFLCLTRTGQFVGLRLDGVVPFRCPDIGSLANGKDKSNLLVEKRSVVLPGEPSLKNEFFRSGLRDFGAYEPLALVCLAALENPECCAAMEEALNREKIKASDRISFLVEDIYLVESPAIGAWWQEYRQQFRPPIKAEDASLCLITGQPTAPMATVPPTTGLGVVGGHPRGDALICFDKPAFCSYGLKKSANAPVSEEAFAQVKVALDVLLKGAPILAGMKFVHWYDKPLPKQSLDPLPPIFGSFLPQEDNETDVEPDPEDDQVVMQQARREADALVGSVKSGQAVTDLPNRYYILLLSGANGRVVVRQFTQGSYEELKAHLEQWNQELQLVNSQGTGVLKPFQLTARMIHLLKRQNSDKNVMDRLEKEVKGLSISVIHAILQGGSLPDAVASRAIAYIRSQMLAEEPGAGAPLVPDAIACQWLKVWLIRNQKEVALMPEYNPQHPSAAYHIGAMVSVYAALQQTAYPDVNVTVVQRFFASAQQTPALVLGRLAKLSTHHLAKLDSPAVARVYEARLAQLSVRVGDSVPSVLSLPEQSLFALGYYQMSAAIQKERLERSSKKQSTIETKEED